MLYSDGEMCNGPSTVTNPQSLVYDGPSIEYSEDSVTLTFIELAFTLGPYDSVQYLPNGKSIVLTEVEAGD